MRLAFGVQCSAFSKRRAAEEGGRQARGGKTCGIRHFILIAALILISTGCSSKVDPKGVEVKRQTVTGVDVTEVRPVQVDSFLETSGTVKAGVISSVASRLMGTVTSLNVREGDEVRAGQTLLTIDDSDIAQKVKASEAGYREAQKALETAQKNRELVESTYGRYKKLHDEKALSQQEMDQLETQKKVAELDYERVREMVNRAAAGLAEAKVYQGFTRVTAPVSGRVTEKKIDRGSMAVPGAPLIVIENTAVYNVEAGVDERLSSALRVGTPVDVIIEASSRQIKGTIREVLPSVDPMSRTFTVKIGVQGSDLRTGQYAKVRIPEGKKEAFLAPSAAVVQKGQLTGVYAVDDKGVITYRLVRTGKTYGGDIEILSGLEARDRIITGGVERAVDGGIIAQQKAAEKK